MSLPLVASCSATFLKAIGTPGCKRINVEGGTSSEPILSDPSLSLSITCSLSEPRALSCSRVWPGGQLKVWSHTGCSVWAQTRDLCFVPLGIVMRT